MSALGATAGLVGDALAGDPGGRCHPVAAFGAAMTAVERQVYAPSRGRGVLYAACGTAIGLGAGRAVRSTALAATVAVARRGLVEAALAVHRPLAAGDLETARAALPALVGRDPTQLDEAGIARAVIESVAENAVDAVVAPVLWGAVGGAPAVLAHRAVNTMDAMVGHRSDRYERFGWASARLDDLAGWVPARLTVALVAATHPGRAAEVARVVRRDAPTHPSPNAGPAEAAFAAALGVRLGGTNTYGDRPEHRGPLGDGRQPAPGDIPRAVELLDRITVLLGLLLGATGVVASAGRAGLLGRRRRPWRRPPRSAPCCGRPG